MLRSGSVLLFLYSTQTPLMSRLAGAVFGIVLCEGLGIVRVLPVRWAPLTSVAGSAGTGRQNKGRDFYLSASCVRNPSGIRSGKLFFLNPGGRSGGSRRAAGRRGGFGRLGRYAFVEHLLRHRPHHQ